VQNLRLRRRICTPYGFKAAKVCRAVARFVRMVSMIFRWNGAVRLAPAAGTARGGLLHPLRPTLGEDPLGPHLLEVDRQIHRLEDADALGARLAVPARAAEAGAQFAGESAMRRSRACRAWAAGRRSLPVRGPARASPPPRRGPRRASVHVPSASRGSPIGRRQRLHRDQADAPPRPCLIGRCAPPRC